MIKDQPEGLEHSDPTFQKPSTKNTLELVTTKHSRNRKTVQKRRDINEIPH
jgi:hypothetical protein